MGRFCPALLGATPLANNKPSLLGVMGTHTRFTPPVPAMLTNSASLTATVPLTATAPLTSVVRIHTIQGASHISPYVTTVHDNSTAYGAAVANVPGIVTAVAANGFYLQDPMPDDNPAAAEGLFVFTGPSGSKPNVGDALVVSGAVAEFRPSCTNASCTTTESAWANLTTTELAANRDASVSLTWQRVSANNPLPAAIVLGAGGRVPLATVIETNSSIETVNPFAPAQAGIHFSESLEGMRVQINQALVVGPTTSNGEIAVLPDNGSNAGPRTPRGGIIVGEQYTDFNPERIIIDDTLITHAPTATVGDSLGTVIGVLDYSFGNYKLYNTQALTLTAGGLAQEMTTLTAGPHQLTMADFNVENFAPGNTRLQQTAALILHNLGAPDLVAMQEIQDNSGPLNNGVVAADQTIQPLLDAICAAGGPIYQYRQINPVNNQDGGQLGGNIRQVFLFRTDRGLAFVNKPGGDATTTNTVQNVNGQPTLQYSPGRIDPTNAAWNNSRKPLAAEFTYRGHPLFVINNHFNSKGGG